MKDSGLVVVPRDFVVVVNWLQVPPPTYTEAFCVDWITDILGQEVKKGLHERRRQGLYLGLLPFGAAKGPDGIPVPHPDILPGLTTAFELAAQGKSDREIARALNAEGYGTAGNQGKRLFSKDTVKGILTNQFYIGQIPDGNGGWMDAQHDALIPLEVFEAAQATRDRNRRNPAKRTRADARGVLTVRRGSMLRVRGDPADDAEPGCGQDGLQHQT